MSEIQTNNPTNAGTARVLDEKLLFRGNWAEIVELSYEDDKNKYVNGKDCIVNIVQRQ
jgi:hypothetical protein